MSKALIRTMFSNECKEFLIGLLETCNFCQFEKKFYRQLRGTAIGSYVAPAYANIVMADLVEDINYVSHHFAFVFLVVVIHR